ncbi:agglutinin-2-like [Bidens hawaiensis]|uniref:agglutinin-2-like n=1 Tax=Bidens hawaiensis TaxID=980011 RepID=UPI00404AC100
MANQPSSSDAAYSSDEGIQVTHQRTSDQYDSFWLAGRATYAERLHLWDKNTYDLANFSTSFTFVIDSYPNNNYADGLTFFLAQNNSVINAGGMIGLPYDHTTNTSNYRFVAVEFDTYSANSWDPKYPGTNKSIGDHVGININSATSVAYRKWFSNITYGKECKALIEYNSDSKKLSVSFISFINNSPVWETGLHYTYDLRHVLPEWVIFGFSASTRNQFEKHNIISW